MNGCLFYNVSTSIAYNHYYVEHFLLIRQYRLLCDRLIKIRKETEFPTIIILVMFSNNGLIVAIGRFFHCVAVFLA